MFFRFPFGISGDRAAIPATAQLDGSVSYEEGYPFDYQRPLTDQLRKEVERDRQNDLFYQITLAIQQYQTMGFPDFITTLDNGGTPYSYAFDAYVRYNDGNGPAIYRSIVATNTALPTDATKWERIKYGAFPSASGLDYYGDTLPDGGWLWADGKTIGSASSGATARANADTQTLYTILWTSQTNAVLPIQDNTGAASVRGASAAADFAANKRLPLPDKRGRVSAGKDDMGGAAANRLTNARPGGIVGNVLGAFGGEEAHQTTVEEMPAHRHNLRGSGGSSGPQNALSKDSPNNSLGTGLMDPAGGDLAHNNIQPTLICNSIIKL